MARYAVKVLPWAVTDVRENYLYLLAVDEHLAEEFERCVREALVSLSETAHRYQERRDGVRRCPLKRFPHGIIYEIEDHDASHSATFLRRGQQDASDHRCHRLRR